MNRPLCLAALVLCCSACDERGIEVGSEDACRLDPLLVAAEERSGPRDLSPCARVAESRPSSLHSKSPEIPASHASVPKFAP